MAPGRVEFEVPPGPIELEIAVEDASAEVLDRETRKIIVPGLGLGLTLSTPEVFRGRTLPEWQALAADAEGDAGRSSVNSAAPIACSFASARKAPAARPCSRRAC